MSRRRASASGARRLGRALEVTVAVVLAVGAAVLAIGLADRRFVRVDLSANRTNTLDPELLSIVERLPETARIDLFLRPLEAPYDRLHAEAAGRFLDELQRIVGGQRDRLEVVDYSASGLEESATRMRELGVEGTNIVVVSCGDRRTRLRLFGELVTVDWGNPRIDHLRYLDAEGISGIVDPRTYRPNEFQPARVLESRASSRLGEALLRVGVEDRPLAVLVQGHGESDPAQRGGEGLSRLRKLLVDEGFEVEPWLGAREGDLPADAALVLLIGPRKPLPPEDLTALETYVDDGGQLLVAPSTLELERDVQRGARAVLEAQGLQLEPGIVCLPLQGRGGVPIMGVEEVLRFQVGEQGLAASHPTTSPLRSDNRSVEFFLTAAFQRANVQTVGDAGTRTRLALVSAPQGAWLDLPLEGTDGRYDYRYEPERETRTRATLVMTSEVPLGAGGGRVLGIGSSTFLEDELFDSNFDFLRNAVNWLAHRDTRLRIAARNPLSSRLELREGRALATLNGVLLFGLPLASGLVALGIAWRRRRA